MVGIDAICIGQIRKVWNYCSTLRISYAMPRFCCLGRMRHPDVDPRHPLRRVLRDLHRAHLSDEIQVSRLDQDGTRALIAATHGAVPLGSSLVDLV